MAEKPWRLAAASAAMVIILVAFGLVDQSRPKHKHERQNGDMALRKAAGGGAVAGASVTSEGGWPPAPPVAFDSESNVCMLTIMTQERLASLHRMLSLWDGWASIALLVDDYATAAPQGTPNDVHVCETEAAIANAPMRLLWRAWPNSGCRRRRAAAGNASLQHSWRVNVCAGRHACPRQGT